MTTKPKGGALAKLAGMLCTNPKFQAFLRAESAEQAADRIRAQCGVESRAQLDSDAQAAERFHKIRREFAYGGNHA